MESIFCQRLNDRDLWVDGDSSLHIDAICNEILKGNLDFLESEKVSESAKSELKNFIQYIDEKIPGVVTVKNKNSIGELDKSFNIPKKYLSMNLEKRIIRGFKKRHPDDSLSEEERDERLYRIADELKLYSTMGLLDVLKCSAYVVDRLKEKDMVWGPGRGSACCSYILYLMEVHDIDSFEFDLSIDEFLR